MDQQLSVPIGVGTLRRLTSAGIAAMMQLNPVTYNWTAEATGTPTHAGFIAQQVLPTFPDLVSQGDGRGSGIA